MLRSWSTIFALFSLLGSLSITSGETKTTCNNYSSRYKKGLEGVCVCNESQCDTISNEYLNLQSNQVGIYSTSRCGKRLEYTVQGNDASNDSPDFTIETNIQYQKILGFGGAFTDAAAVNVQKLTPKLQQTFLDSYYTSSGLEYTVGRIPIASTDFSESVYSYNPVVDDFEMKHFSIDADRTPKSFKLELIKRAIKTSTREIKMFASSWAPPTWMTRENKTEDSHVKGSPGGPYWKAMALYYLKFIQAYQAEGIQMWGMTVQNEPQYPIIQLKHWQSLRLTAEEERDFIKLDLGPLIKQYYPQLHIIANDDQKPDLLDRQLIYHDPLARHYISGVGIHWYKNLDFIIGFNGDFDKLKKFHDKYPDLFILATEACEGSMPDWLGSGSGTKLQNPKKIWWRAEAYGRDIINDLANYVVGWTDWNIALDTNGGPNWAKNNVDAPILIDEQSGTEFYKQPMYYILGHFSKFVPPGSIRVNLKGMKWWKIWLGVDRVAFLTPEGRVVVILFNRREFSVTVALRVNSNQKSVQVTLAPKTLQTIVFPNI